MTTKFSMGGEDERVKDDVAVQTQVFVTFDEMRDAGGPAGAAMLTNQQTGRSVLFLEYHTTPLWYGLLKGSHGMRRDLVQWAVDNDIESLFFHNLTTDKIYSVAPTLLQQKGFLRDLGGKGSRYYLPLEHWTEHTELPFKVRWVKDTMEVDAP